MLPPPAGCRGAEGCHRGGAAPRLLPACCSLPGVLRGAVPPPAGTERHRGKERYPLPWITSVSRDMMRTLTECRRGAHVDDSLQHRAPSSILALRSAGAPALPGDIAARTGSKTRAPWGQRGLREASRGAACHGSWHRENGATSSECKPGRVRVSELEAVLFQ